MTRPYTIDLDSPDYRAAVTALEWAFVNAQRLKYTLPTGFEMALQLLKDEAKVIMFLSSPKGGFFSVVEAGEDAGEEDFDDFLELLKKRGERKREKRRIGKEAAEAVAAFARDTAMLPATESNAGETPVAEDGSRSMPIMPHQRGGLARAKRQSEGAGA